MHAVQRLWRQHLLQHFHRVVRDDANIFYPRFARTLEQSANARLMHFAAQKIHLGQHLRNMRCRLAHAKANFKYRFAWLTARRKQTGWLDQLRFVRHQVLRAK